MSDPRWTRPDVIMWAIGGIVSGVTALGCAALAVVNARNILWADSVGGVNPENLGSALTALTGLLLFGLISSTCTVVAAVISRSGVPSTASQTTVQPASER